MEGDPRETLVRVYNKFLVDMLLAFKRDNPSLKQALKQKHKAIDSESDRYLRHAERCLPRQRLVSPDLEVQKALDDPDIMRFEPLEGLQMSDLLGQDRNSEADRKSLTAYLYVLGTICATLKESEDESCTEPARVQLVSSVLRFLSKAQTHGLVRADVIESGIMDDDISELLRRVAVSQADVIAESDVDVEVDSEDPLLRSLANSKIADIAREITEEIDLSKLPNAPADGETIDPSKFLDFSSLGDSGSLLGSIVTKVGAKLQNKLASGELKHQDLLSEAMTLMRSVDSRGGGGGGGGGMGPLFQEALKAAAGAGAGTGSSGGSSSVRDRLREKHARKGARK
jgi:hypothetical protein